MRKLLILLFVTIGFSQTTFTDEEIINLENDFIYLENMVDSLAFEDSLKTILVSTLEEELELTNEELKLTNEQLKLTEDKVKLVKPSWWENKWLYFGYGSGHKVHVHQLYPKRKFLFLFLYYSTQRDPGGVLPIDYLYLSFCHLSTLLNLQNVTLLSKCL